MKMLATNLASILVSRTGIASMTFFSRRDHRCFNLLLWLGLSFASRIDTI